MLENISRIDVYIALAINGIATGIGVALGTYFANTHIIERANKLKEKIALKLKSK